MASEGIDSPWAFLITFMLVGPRAQACTCPGATVLAQFPSSVPAGACCLNYSGSRFGHVLWPTLTAGTSVQVLDLSHCNITHIETGGPWTPSAPLQEVYLGHNSLVSIQGDFLANVSSLRVLDLGLNQLKELPAGFLQDSDGLQELDLRGNRLESLPPSLFLKPGLSRLELRDNPWACTCTLAEGLHPEGRFGNGSSGLRGAVGNLTCASPRLLRGRSAWEVRPADVCRPPRLTALFILLPLILLAVLVLCWCCGRKRKRRKEAPAFDSAGKKASANGRRSHAKPPAGGGPPTGEGRKEGILKNQLLLRPASTLLSSTRDIYEEVEIKLGSVENLPQDASSPASSDRPMGAEAKPGSRVADEAQEEGLELGSKPELETVSVTEVMKDSADREKAYLTQSTEYYSLVPGIDLDDSDHGEYESVDLS